MLTIIGCGNANRCDDGVGPYVIGRLQEQSLPEGVRAVDAGTAGMEVMFRARGSTALILIDASRSGACPGTLFRVPGEELVAEHRHGANLHDFRWQHALYAGRKMYRNDFPEEVAVYLIEACSLELGVELSAEVRKSADELVLRLLDDIQQYVARQAA